MPNKKLFGQMVHHISLSKTLICYIYSIDLPVLSCTCTCIHMNDQCSYVRLYSSRSYNIIDHRMCMYIHDNTYRSVICTVEAIYNDVTTLWDTMISKFNIFLGVYSPDSPSNWYMVCIRTVVIFQYIDKN